jgi:hypothetical protein
MALRYVGSRCCRTASYHPGRLQTYPGCYRKFTKWIEVRPIAKVTSKEAVKFIGDIKHRFGVPNRIITDLGAVFCDTLKFPQ